MARLKQAPKKTIRGGFLGGGKHKPGGNPATTTAATSTRAKKTYHFKPGTRALREICQHQRSTDTLIPSASFCKLVRELVYDAKREDPEANFRITASALEALQEATEAYMRDLHSSFFSTS
ncbi:hypothetical protein G7Y79_00052g087890 [Physcia stellaris]|nr:hypothetical protein G7Y79_00052g087890 [Physcia stellaris]